VAWAVLGIEVADSEAGADLEAPAESAVVAAIESAVGTFLAAERAAVAATHSPHRAASTDRARTPRADVGHRAQDAEAAVSGAVAVVADAVAVDGADDTLC